VLNNAIFPARMQKTSDAVNIWGIWYTHFEL
jgi:hypothetical protein